MPGAACLTCLSPTLSIGLPLGKLNEPIGCCHACHSLVCGHHGQRDPHKPAFLCVLCVPSLAVATASTFVAPTPATTTKTFDGLKDFFERNLDAIPTDWLESESPASFQRWSREGSIITRLIARRLAIKENADPDARATIMILKTSSKAETFVVFARLLVDDYKIPADQLPKSFQVLVDATELIVIF